MQSHLAKTAMSLLCYILKVQTICQEITKKSRVLQFSVVYLVLFTIRLVFWYFSGAFKVTDIKILEILDKISSHFFDRQHFHLVYKWVSFTRTRSVAPIPLHIKTCITSNGSNLIYSTSQCLCFCYSSKQFSNPSTLTKNKKKKACISCRCGHEPAIYSIIHLNHSFMMAVFFLRGSC